MGRIWLCGAALLLSGCQSVHETWDSTKTTMGGWFESPPATETTYAAPAPAAATPAAVTTTHGLTPVRSTATLASFQIPDQHYADEDRNYGTPPVSSLIPENYRAPTPTTLAGGKLITTFALHTRLVNDNPIVLINTQPGQATDVIPGSVWLSGAGKHGTLSDTTQQQLSERLHSLTDGNRNHTLVFYCSGHNCWSAYNAALRAVNMRYTDVLWYRGGLSAWFSAGLPAEITHNDIW